MPVKVDVRVSQTNVEVFRREQLIASHADRASK